MNTHLCTALCLFCSCLKKNTLFPYGILIWYLYSYTIALTIKIEIPSLALKTVFSIWIIYKQIYHHHHNFEVQALHFFCYSTIFPCKSKLHFKLNTFVHLFTFLAHYIPKQGFGWKNA